MTFQPTEEQAAIVEAASSPSPLLVEAYAGTAKTTTICLAAPRISLPALALAFNRRIAQELKGKLPGNWQIKTLNGLGHGAWARGLPASLRLDVDERKLGKLVTQVAKEQKVDLSRDQWASVRQLVEKVMQAGISPGDEGEPLQPDLPEVWEDIAAEEGIPQEDRPLQTALARSVLEQSIALAKLGKISYDDQIYCPTILSPRRGWLKFPALAVDEAQDLSPLNHRMLQLTSRADSKIIAVGDSRQAIYAFRGADSQSFSTLRASRPSWQELALTMTFRCPHRIVERQQEHAPGYRAHSSVRRGFFGRFEKTDTLEGWGYQTFLEATPQATSRVILCRNNAPLLKLAFALIRRRIGPAFAGRDLAGGLLALLRRITRETDSADVLRGKIEDWEISEKSKALGEGKEHLLDGIEDKAQSLIAVLEGVEARSRGDLEAGLKEIFSREESSAPILLSSIHRAKGLEWDAVLHLDPGRIAAAAKRARRRGDLAQVEQEKNLRYVAETRTRNYLLEANLESFQ